MCIYIYTRVYMYGQIRKPPMYQTSRDNRTTCIEFLFNGLRKYKDLCKYDINNSETCSTV